MRLRRGKALPTAGFKVKACGIAWRSGIIYSKHKEHPLVHKEGAKYMKDHENLDLLKVMLGKRIVHYSFTNLLYSIFFIFTNITIAILKIWELRKDEGSFFLRLDSW